MNALILDAEPDCRGAFDTLLWNKPEEFDRYENPFEQKWVWRDKRGFPPVIENLVRGLEGLIAAAQGLVPEGVALVSDITRHYAGAFVYDPGDHLSVHVDAGVHPASGYRKAVTALLYLGGGAPLEFWEGDECVDDDPVIRKLAGVLYPSEGMVVLFANDDTAWHGVPRNDDPPRALLTVSFLAREFPMNCGWENSRQRAFFVPRPSEEWPEELYALRDRRADPERFSEVYRTGGTS